MCSAYAGAIDLLFVVLSVLLVSVFLQILDLRVVVGLMAVRMVAMVLILYPMSAPIRAWQDHERPDAALVLETEQALDRFGRLLGRVATAGWVLVFALGFPLSRALGDVAGKLEYLAGVGFALAALVALPVMSFALVDTVFRPLRVEIGRASLELGISSTRRSSSIGQDLPFLVSGILASLLLSLTATLCYQAGVIERRKAEAVVLQQVAEAGAQLRAGVLEPTQLGPELSLIEFDELPAELAPREGESWAIGEVRHTYYIHDEQARAATAIDERRWLLAEGHADVDIVPITAVFVFFCVSSMVPGGLAILGYRRSLLGPLRELDQATRRLVEKGDLSGMERIVPVRNDEIGALVRNFNRMLDLLDSLAAAATAVTAGDLGVEISGRGELPQALRGMLGRLHEVVVQIRLTALDLASAAAEIHAITTEQEQAIEQQSQRVLDVSDKVATLAQSAESVSKAAGEVLDNAEQTLGTTDAMIDRIASLNTQAAGVRALLELIREVADRSDLLALNGSLEATRAGEAGRGFALVASEMRRLAERVTGTIGDVRERISEIERAGESTVRATDDNRRLANETADAARAISQFTSRQSEETDQVSVKMFEVAEVMITTVEAAKQTLAAAEGLRGQAAELERLTAQFEVRELQQGHPQPSSRGAGTAPPSPKPGSHEPRR